MDDVTFRMGDAIFMDVTKLLNLIENETRGVIKISKDKFKRKLENKLLAKHTIQARIVDGVL
jgi:hypothetical protein